MRGCKIIEHSSTFDFNMYHSTPGCVVMICKFFGHFETHSH